MPNPSSSVARPKPTPTPIVKGGPPSWGPFVVAVIGVVVAAALLAVVGPGVLPMTMETVPFVIIPGMILSFTAAGASMGWMFLLFGRFGRRTRWLWPSGILIAVVILELLALTYLAGIADQAAGGG